MCAFQGKPREHEALSPETMKPLTRLRSDYELNDEYS